MIYKETELYRGSSILKRAQVVLNSSDNALKHSVRHNHFRTFRVKIICDPHKNINSTNKPTMSAPTEHFLFSFDHREKIPLRVNLVRKCIHLQNKILTDVSYVQKITNHEADNHNYNFL